MSTHENDEQEDFLTAEELGDDITNYLAAQIDPEVDAIRFTVNSFERLDVHARRRVFCYLADRYEFGKVAIRS